MMSAFNIKGGPERLTPVLKTMIRCMSEAAYVHAPELQNWPWLPSHHRRRFMVALCVASLSRRLLCCHLRAEMIINLLLSRASLCSACVACMKAWKMVGLTGLTHQGGGVCPDGMG